MGTNSKYHAIKVDRQKCYGCTHCMKVCPTEAIRVRNGKAVISAERCVDCGNCLRVCPAKAFFVEHDSLEQIRKFQYRVILIPAVMIGQFPEKYTEDRIYNALLELGFTHIFEVEQPIGLLIEAIYNEVDTRNRKPLISSFCPAIVRLISKKYPSWVDNIVRLVPPQEMAAQFAVQQLLSQNIERDRAGIFYATPCSAKMAEVKNPAGGRPSVIDGLINMKELYNNIMAVINRSRPTDLSGMRRMLSRDGIVWSLPRGEARHFKNRSMAIDGIHNVVKFLERMENNEVPELDFLELKSCDQGCAGGILLTGNRFLTVERLQKRSKKYPFAAGLIVDKATSEVIRPALETGAVKAGYVFALDESRNRALEKLQKASKILCQLPGIDCGGCGAPNCHALAEDIVQGKAKMTDCIFLQHRYLKDKKISIEKGFHNLERTWGEKRFDADCNIKGGRNEGF